MASGDLILYSTDDGLAQFTLREMDGQVWLTQLEMAELYQTASRISASISRPSSLMGSWLKGQL